MLRLISHLKVRGGAQDVAEALGSAIQRARLPVEIVILARRDLPERRKSRFRLEDVAFD